jgi:hypothetical protein
MSDEFLEESDGDRKAIELQKAKRTTLIADMSARQAPYLDLIALYHKLFWELPEISTRDVDARLQVMFDKLMEVSATVGISRLSVPSLKECCGKKRVWPDELGKSQIMEAVKDAGGLGDLLKKIFSLFGAKPCEGCERRRRWLNGIRWPWNKR